MGGAWDLVASFGVGALFLVAKRSLKLLFPVPSLLPFLRRSYLDG